MSTQHDPASYRCTHCKQRVQEVMTKGGLRLVHTSGLQAECILFATYEPTTA